jgi:MFS transporter, PHS family, inorganic phosphate transporter
VPQAPICSTVTYTVPWIWRTSESRPKEKLQPWEGHLAKPETFLSGFRNFMWDEGNWRYLAGTSICWMLFDFAFYGLGMSQPRHLAEIWSSNGFKDSGLADWSQVHSNSTELPTVSDFLHQQASTSLLIPTIGVLTGSCVVFFSVNHLERRKLQVFGFIGLFAILLFLGVQFSQFFKDSHSILIPFFLFLSHVFFNIGKYTLS